MADIVENVVIKLAVTDEASAPSAKVTAAQKELGDAMAVAAQKANQLSAASAAARAAQTALAAAQREAKVAAGTGDTGRIASASTNLATAQAEAEQARVAQAAARAALEGARAAQSLAKAAVAQAERETAQAAANAAELAAVTRERQNEAAAVEQLAARIGALQVQRESATAADRVGIDAEIAGLRRAVTGHEEEGFALDQKAVKLREVAAVAAATSAEETAAIRVATDARLVELRVMRDQQVAAASRLSVTGEAESAGAESAESKALLGAVGLGGFGSVIALTAVTMAAGKFTGALKESVEAARQAQEANDRLRASLQDNAGLYDEVTAAAAQTATASRFSAEQLTAVAERLNERGVDAGQLPRALKAAADVAVALHKPIEDVADQIAQTFGGTVPRDLKHAVSGLQQLSQAELEAGGALDVLEQRFGGRALSDSLTLTGREAESVRDYGEAWKQVGATLLPLYQNVMLKLRGAATVGLGEVSTLAANGGSGFKATAMGLAGDLAGAILPGQLGTSVASSLHSAESQANVDAALKAKADANAELAAAGAAARAQVEQLRTDDARAVADGGAKELTEVQKRLEEEVRLRKAGVDELIAAINNRSAAEVKPLDDALRTAVDQRGHAASAADSQRDIAQGAFNRGDEPARNTANIAEAAERQKVLDLDAEILKLRQQISAVTKTAADDQSKALADAGKMVGEDVNRAGQQLHEQLYQVSRTDGLNPLDAYGKGADAANAYAQSIAVADAHLNQLIADATKANDPATAGALSEIKLKIDVDAQHTLDQVHTLAGDIHASLEQPLTQAFDKMITTQGSFSDRLKAGERSFLESVANMLAEYAAKMAANAVLTALLGPAAGQAGGGQQGIAGPAGGLIGAAVTGIGGLLFGGGSNASGGSTTGTTQAQQPASSPFGGLIGAAVGGIGKLLGGAIGGLFGSDDAPPTNTTAAPASPAAPQGGGGGLASALGGGAGLLGMVGSAAGSIGQVESLFGGGHTSTTGTMNVKAGTVNVTGASGFDKILGEINGTLAAVKGIGSLVGSVGGMFDMDLGGGFGMGGGGGGGEAGAGAGGGIGGLTSAIGNMFGGAAGGAAGASVFGSADDAGQGFGDDVDSGDAGGGLLDKIGGAFDSVGDGVGDVAGGVGDAVGGAASAIGSAAAGAASAVGEGASSVLPLLAGLLAFDTGGYTGDGHPKEPAGVVHKGEFVMHADATRHYGTGLLDQMNRRQLRPMANAAASQMRAPDPVGSGSSVSSAMADFGRHVKKIGKAGEAMQDAAEKIGSHQPVLVMNEQTAAQLASSPSLQRNLATQQLNNPSTWGPVHKAYGK